MDLAELADLAYLEARCRDSVDKLVEELAQLGRGDSTPLVAILETLLLVHREILTREPDRLFSVLYDDLSWREEFRPWAEQARAIFEARPGASWRQRLRRPSVLAAALPFWRASGDPRALTRDGVHLLLEREKPRHEFLLVDVKARAAQRTFSSDASIGARLSPDGTRVLTFSGSTAQLWDTGSGAVLRELGPQQGPIQRTAISRDHGIVFAMSAREVRAWRIADGTSIVHSTTAELDTMLPCGADAVVFHERGTGWWRWDGATAPTHAADDTGSWTIVAVSPTGDCLLQVRDHGQTLEGWSLPGGTRRFEQRTRDYTMSFAFDATGAFFAANDGVIRDATTGAEVRRIPGGTSPHPSFDPLGRYLVTRHDERARLWDLASGALAAEVTTGRIGELRAHWSDDGRVLVLGDWHQTLVADLSALAPIVPRREPRLRYEWMTRFSPSGATLVVDHEGGVGFWDVARGAMRTFIECPPPLSYFAANTRLLVRRGDSLVALATEDGATVWQADLPRAEYEQAHAADALGVLLVDPRSTGDVVALAMDDGRELYRLAGVRVACFDRDVFLTRTDADGVSVRSTATGVETASLATGRTNTFAVSPDRRWLAAYTDDIDIWDLTTRARHRTISPGASSIHFREDGALEVYTAQSQQSGNQDWNEETAYDVVTGDVVHQKGWWDNEVPSGPDELTCTTASGETFVATTRSGELEIFRVRLL